MDKDDKIIVSIGLVPIIFFILCAVGWIANIVQVLDMPYSTAFFIKMMGLFFAPLGVVLGWIGIFS